MNLELAAAERRISEHAMRHQMVAVYLSAFIQIRINTIAQEENERNKARGILTSTAVQSAASLFM